MKKSDKVILGAAAAVAISGGAYAMHYNSDQERAKRDVLGVLIDPDSAIFSDIEVCREGGRIIHVTGLVNSRNSMGGMVGKRRFLSSAIGSSGFDTSIEHIDKSEDENLADKFVTARVQTQSAS